MSFEECDHKCEHDTHYDHITCKRCWGILTDGGWGVASRKWFSGVTEAKFYQKHGRLPEPLPAHRHG